MVPLIIYILVPLAGALAYLWLILKMKKENIPNPPVVELFLVFAAQGGMLVVLLTALFWRWSGMASLGSIGLVFVAPFIMGMIAFKHKTTTLSPYHKMTRRAALLYFVTVPLVILLSFTAEFFR